MKVFSIYNIGSFILFIGLLWMFLPHTAHELILNEIEESEHYIHLIEGLILTLSGLGLMILSQKYNKK